MAISPIKLIEKFQEDVDLYEKEIDSRLSKKSISKGQSIYIRIPSGLDHTHFYVLRDRYIKAGWSKVNLILDQRDGDYLKFES
jgi:hypothetical protein